MKKNFSIFKTKIESVLRRGKDEGLSSSSPIEDWIEFTLQEAGYMEVKSEDEMLTENVKNNELNKLTDEEYEKKENYDDNGYDFKGRSREKGYIPPEGWLDEADKPDEDENKSKS